MNNNLFSACAFEEEFFTTHGNIMSPKVTGNKGKSKSSAAQGVLTTGDFLKAAGLTPEGKGSYVKVSARILKTKVPRTPYQQDQQTHPKSGQCLVETLPSSTRKILKPQLREDIVTECVVTA